jgi:hypothetical protein
MSGEGIVHVGTTMATGERIGERPALFEKNCVVSNTRSFTRGFALVISCTAANQSTPGGKWRQRLRPRMAAELFVDG